MVVTVDVDNTDNSSIGSTNANEVDNLEIADKVNKADNETNKIGKCLNNCNK